jgi:DNA adenine methylase
MPDETKPHAKPLTPAASPSSPRSPRRERELNSDPQLSLPGFEGRKTGKIVNVASVKQLSPFRYPGGKTWLVPMARDWLRKRRSKPSEFVEIFAGGGIIGLTVANESLAEHVILIELDPDVSAVWRTILSDDSEWLAQQILQFKLDMKNLGDALERPPQNLREHAFQTILRNRVNHGGILAPGSGVIKSGENGKGIASRWYPETLARRIRAIAYIKDRISFIEGDGIQYFSQHSNSPNITWFMDPPYTAPGKRAGTRLYRYSEIDHEALFNWASRARGNFMMTYDDAESVHAMANQYGFKIDRVKMKGTHHNETYELLITPG